MIILEDLEIFLVKQPEMEITLTENEKYTIEGFYNLSSSFNNIYLDGRYNIKIEVSKKYPEIIPKVLDIDKTIPENFEHFHADRSFCLGSPMELYLLALEYKISEFLIKLIDSYLYSVTYFLKYNSQFPYGERSHGIIGILDFWKEYLNTDDFKIIYNIMSYASKGNYRGHNPCPCGSQEKLRNCHGSKILPIIKGSLSEKVKDEIYFIKKGVEEAIEYQKTTSR